jgi:hypothetical protein
VTTPATHISHHPFNDPYVLKCGHTFEKEKAQAANKCPTCKTKVNPEEASSNVALVKTQKVADEIILALTEVQEKHREAIIAKEDELYQKKIIIQEHEITLEAEQSLRRSEELENLKIKEELLEFIRLQKSSEEKLKTLSVPIEETHTQESSIVISSSASALEKERLLEKIRAAKRANTETSVKYCAGITLTLQALFLGAVTALTAASPPVSPILLTFISSSGVAMVTAESIVLGIERYEKKDKEIEKKLKEIKNDYPS